MSGSKKTGAPTRITLYIDLGSEDEAGKVAGALKVDDDDYMSTIVEGCTVRGEVEADSVEGARRAADDWLACLMAIVKKE